MSHLLTFTPQHSTPVIELPYSKSEANRLLIAQTLSEEKFEVEVLSNAKDTQILIGTLSSSATEINVGMAGTAFRFLTAYYALQMGQERVLTGDERMKERPIGILVDQLKMLGAEISYLGKQGYPPLRIKGKQLLGTALTVEASISSQYITALLLIAPKLKGGLQLQLKGELVSLPYIDLTLALQRKLGVDTIRKGNRIVVKEGDYFSKTPIAIERDWSSAAFFYQLVAFSGKSLRLNGVVKDSLQGDKACSAIFKSLGVETVFDGKGATLNPISIENTHELTLDLKDTPDLIPSVVVCASQLIAKTTIIGTQTLYLKESDRVEALKKELNKVGVQIIEIDRTTIQVRRSTLLQKKDEEIHFSSYNDHRMAMCLAPMVCLFQKISLDSLSVVEKSFPFYWRELEKLGITVA